MNATERYVLEQMTPELQADGFAVFVEPGRQMLPAFMGGYRPDAIAIGAHRNLAIEIKSDDSARPRKLDSVAGLFEDQKDWELRIYYARPAPAESNPPLSSESSVAEAVTAIRRLIASGERRAALLMGWATLEAEGRRHLPPGTRWPQTIANLLERLAFDGVVTPTEADLLRRLAADRNRLIHGYLDIDVKDVDLLAFVETIELLTSLDRPNHPEAATAAQ